MKKLLTKIRHKLIRWLGGEIPAPALNKPLIISKTVPLSVIEAKQYIPGDHYWRLPTDVVKRNMEKLLAEKIGEEIVATCGVMTDYNVVEDIYCFRVAVEVVSRSLRNGERREVDVGR